MSSRVQRKSEAFRYGEGKDHEAACKRLCNILIDNGWEIFPNTIFDVEYALRSQEDTKLGHSRYYHEFDIYARKKNSNGLMSELCIECDGRSHNSKVQQGKDKTAEQYAAFFLPDAKFRRIHIDLILDKTTPDASLRILAGTK